MSAVLSPIGRPIGHVFGGAIDVRGYGAIAGTDSTVALQRAIDACPAGGALWISEPYLTDELTLDDFSDRAILGNGSLELIPGAADDAAILRLEGDCTNVEVAGPTLIGHNNSAKFQIGIAASAGATVTNAKVHHCTIKQINVGVYVAGYVGGGLYGGWRITQNYFDEIVGTTTGQGLGVICELPLGVIVALNHFRRTGRHAVYHGLGDSGTGYLEVIANTFELHRTGVATVGQVPAVTFGRGTYGKCSANTFRECSDGAVDTFFDTALAKDFRGVQITDNFFINRQNAVPDVTVGLAETPGSYNTYETVVDDNVFIADQADAGTAQFIYIYNGSRGSACGNKLFLNGAVSSQYLMRLGDASVIDSDADCEDWAICDNKAYVQGAAAGSCKLLHVAADICTNTSHHEIFNNRLFGPGYADYGAAVTNPNINTDIP